jgi:crossover junction endodeoxyribonuclease RusA
MADNKINNVRSPNAGFARTDWPWGLVPPGCAPPGPGAISVWVAGKPAPQGSKRYVGRPGGGRGVLIESSKAVKPWRADVRQAFLDHGDTVSPGVATFGPYVAVVVKIVFVMPRPVATPKTKPTPAAVKQPDLDKLVRAVLDAITSAGVWCDDAQVTAAHTHKRIAELGEPTGAMIHLEHVPVLPIAGVSSLSAPSNSIR